MKLTALNFLLQFQVFWQVICYKMIQYNPFKFFSNINENQILKNLKIWVFWEKYWTIAFSNLEMGQNAAKNMTNDLKNIINCKIMTRYPIVMDKNNYIIFDWSSIDKKLVLPYMTRYAQYDINFLTRGGSF